MDIIDSTPAPLQINKSSKLPIKRRAPDDPNQPTPPLKFQRIWSEPDEIQFLQGLLDSSALSLSFPRDLGIFYTRFSSTISQSYTKSQLSEKLRRLRKKFRVVSTRLSKGMNESQMSVHDRTLYDMSKRLWHPDFASTSPFNGARSVGGVSVKKSGSVEGERLGFVGVKVNFSPILPVVSSGLEFDEVGNGDFDDEGVKVDIEDVNGDGIEGEFELSGDFDIGNDSEVKLSEVNVELEGTNVAMKEQAQAVWEDEIREVASTAAMGAFDECFRDVKRKIESRGGDDGRLNVRWQEQKIAELDALGSRLRLVLENSLRK